MSVLDLFKGGSGGPKIRYAVVGAGWIAQEDFMPGVAHTGNSELTALVTEDPKKGESLKERYGIPWVCGYDGYDALLSSGKIDAVYIALPNDMHCDFTVRALAAKIHVLCEKPMAPTEEECRKMIEASKSSGAKLMIAYRLHFEEATIEAIETLRSGKLGDPRVFSSAFSQQVDPANHRTKKKYWAGPVSDMGPYPINAVRQLFEAEPLEAMALKVAKNEPRFAEVGEAISVQLRFPDERIAQFTVSYGAADFGQYHVLGTKGAIEVTPGYTWTEGLTHNITESGKISTRQFDKVDQFGGETQYFSKCIFENEEPEPDGYEGLADVRTILAIEKSLMSGQWEKIASTPRDRRPTRAQIIKLKAVKPGPLIDAKPAEAS